MSANRWLALAATWTLVACGTPQPLRSPAPLAAAVGLPEGLPADAQAYSGGNPYRLLGLNELPIVGVTVDSEAPGFSKRQLADGDQSTPWVNGGYRNATAWTAIQLASGAAIASVAIKSGPSPAGTSYDVQVSDDGTAWATALANQTNRTWGLETKLLPAGTSGTFVRVLWHNSASAPQPHFAIYELAINGTAVPAPSPTALATPGSSTLLAPTPGASGSVTPPPPAGPSTGPATDASSGLISPPVLPATALPGASPMAPPIQAPPGPAGVVQAMAPTGTSASSSYAALTPERAVDGDLASQWANDGYQQAEATLALQFPAAIALDHLAVKTGALPAGVTYQVETSSDGVAWAAVTGPLTNTSWAMETKPLAGEGSFLRLHFFNNPAAPLARFYVFELAVYGQVGAAPGPATGPTPAPALAPTPLSPPNGPVPSPVATMTPVSGGQPIPGPMAPTPVRPISLPGQAVASSGNAFALTDGDPSTAWSPTGGAPQWVAVPLSEPASGPLLVAWDSVGFTYLNNNAAPRDYTLQASSDSTDGRDGSWTTVLSASDNPVRSRVDTVQAPGARWIRLATTGIWGYGPALRDLTVYAAASASRLNSWLILGDSITALSMDPGQPNVLAATVQAMLPGYAPVLVAGGTGGDTAAQGLQKLAAGLPLCPPGSFIGIAYGTNDATQNVPVATFKDQLRQMVESTLASGRTPMLARTCHDLNGNLPAYVQAIDELTAMFNLPPGPDLFGWFAAHPEQIGSDSVHPNASGQAAIQRLWGEAVARAYGAP